VTYEPNPCYPVVGGRVEVGYDALVPRDKGVLAVDGPAAAPWEELAQVLRSRGAQLVDLRRSFVPWDEVLRRTASAVLPGDPVFGRLYDGTIDGLLDTLPTVEPGAIVFGPGAALVPHDELWYADLPKRLALAAVQRGAAPNVGQPVGATGTEQRLLYVDWPLLDRHKQELVPRLDRYVDLTDPASPRSLSGDSLRRTLDAISSRPFRTRPTFLPGPWGGQWLRRELGIATEAPNLAWSYELITPESGVLLGTDEPIEVGFELLMAEHADRVLGAELSARFGRAFPIRFDYLDTLDGGHLSIQCHPTDEYARETFGLPYTQQESYYVLRTTPGARIFLGLRDDADVEAFRHDALSGRAFDPEEYLQTHAAEQHRLYLIPAGTPHASGAGNVVLEISATPYLYTLRFYDWQRTDLDGTLRPVHVEHAFANLDPSRRGAVVGRELIQEPRRVRAGPGWDELDLGRSRDLFFAVHRLDFAEEVVDETAGRFHVLNLVAGDEVTIETAQGDEHRLAYAETIVVPAAVGSYRLRRVRGPACKVVKAFVR
jgi:mannose-6-phosphate isomerase class I